MMFYELDYRVWGFHQRWTFDDTYPEIVGKYFFYDDIFFSLVKINKKRFFVYVIYLRNVN